jgi:hypothetical protein
MNENRKGRNIVICGMHTHQFIPLSMDDMRIITGGTPVDEATGDLPTLPPVRNRDPKDPTTGLRTESTDTTVPRIEPPGLNVAAMMGGR